MAGIITQSHASNGLPAYEDAQGVTRFLAKLAPVESEQKKFKHISSLISLVPRSQWKTQGRRQTLGASFITNQQSHGSCVGYSAAQALSRTRVIRGLPYQRLSGAYVYSWINGGRDNGAMISDALGVLQNHGTCLESTVSVNMIYRAQSKVGDTEAQRFKIAAGYLITSNDQGSAFDWLGSAIMCGFVPQFAVEVGNNFERVDANGVLGYDSGYGNHSVHADDLIEINGKWHLDMPNTWGTGFAVEGRGLLTERHIQTIVDHGGEDAFVHVDATDDPQGTNVNVPTA